MSDSNAAMIVQSLIGHQSLKEFFLGGVEFGEETTSAICCLLASKTCKLLDMGLSDPYAQFDFGRFIEQLPVNSSVQSLTLCNFAPYIDHDSANQFLPNLWKLPRLKVLDFGENGIRDLDCLASNVTRTEPYHRLRVLDLSYNDIDFGEQSIGDDHLATRAMLHLLNVFPELRSLGEHVKKIPPCVTERLDLNRCSGMLLRGATIPLSVWALVLAKVNKDLILLGADTQSRTANVIYHILHGPVFAGRGSLDRN